MQTELSIIERLQTLAANAVEYATVSFLFSLAVLLVSAKWRKEKAYFLSAVIVGTVVGYGAGQTTILASFDILLAVIACVTAPSTILFFQHKTIFDVLKEIQNLRKTK